MPEREPRLCPPPPDWYRQLAAHLGEAYLDYAFCRGTEQEAEFLYDALALRPGARLLDVGCGPGRHAIELAKRGVNVVGVDTSSDFLSIARRRAAKAGAALSFFEMDATELAFEDEFDAAVSLCEGGFGLGLDDLKILRGIHRSLRSGGHAAVGAANAYYVVAHLAEGAVFDPVSGLLRESVSGVIGRDGLTRDFEMWNSCYTPRELEWIANGASLDPQFVSGISPGEYRSRPPSFDDPELLLLARKP
jgi:SAM-dependent methyltransferase